MKEQQLSVLGVGMKIFTILSTLLLITSCSLSETEKNMDIEMMHSDEIVTVKLERLLKKNGPGIQYIVVNNTETVFERNIGFADIKAAIPMSSDHTMAAFSMTKTLTAIAILQLVERNEINLDDNITRYISHPYDTHITVRQLLNHTSGIPNPIPLAWVHLSSEQHLFDEQHALNSVLTKNNKLTSKPGTEYQYSNISYWLLGKIIENVTGDTYPDFVTKNIFEVLNLLQNEISFTIVDSKKHAKGYVKKWSLMHFMGQFFIDKAIFGQSEKGWTHIRNVYLNGPSYGGVIWSAKAISRVLQDLLSKHPKLLGSKYIELLHSQQKTSSGSLINMTLGWHLSNLHNEQFYYKEGGGAGFRSEMRLYPQSGIASIIITNKTSFDSTDTLNDLDIHFLTP